MMSTRGRAGSSSIGASTGFCFFLSCATPGTAAVSTNAQASSTSSDFIFIIRLRSMVYSNSTVTRSIIGLDLFSVVSVSFISKAKPKPAGSLLASSVAGVLLICLEKPSM